MSFLKRLGFYLIGLAIGLIFLAFFLSRKNAQFCYLPNCRVLKELRSKPLNYAESIGRQFADQGLDSIDITQIFVDGEVSFKHSDTKAKPCKIYSIHAEIKSRPLRLSVRNCDSITIIDTLQFNTQ